MGTLQSMDTLQNPEKTTPFIYTDAVGDEILTESLEGLPEADPNDVTAILKRADSLTEHMLIEAYQRLERLFVGRTVRYIGVFHDLEAAA